MNENLNRVREMILDEKKLVTYVSLSKELCLHVNESKSLLSQIVEELKNKKSDKDLNVNYIISGLLDSNKAYTGVCNEAEIPTILNKFKTVLFQHLYSVSKGKPSVDNVSLMAVSKFEDLPLCTGLIKSNICIKRSASEIGALKTTSQEIAIKDQKATNTPIGKTKVKEEISNANNIFNKPVVKVHGTKSEPAIKSEVISPKKDSVPNNLQKTECKNGNKTQKGIAGFFSKAVNNPTKKISTEVIVSDQKFDKQENKTSETKENVQIKTEKMDTNENLEVEKVKINDKKLNSENKVKSKSDLSDIKKNAKIDKKRKRVLHVSDSESDDEKNDPFVDEPMETQDSEDEIPPTPAVNTVKITSGIVNPKKRRKIVDKTYTDEDGYILTKKEEVYESCSDNEEELREASVKENVQHTNRNIKTEISPKQMKNGSKNKKKISSPQKGKQATLMSFFKKV